MCLEFELNRSINYQFDWKKLNKKKKITWVWKEENSNQNLAYKEQIFSFSFKTVWVKNGKKKNQFQILKKWKGICDQKRRAEYWNLNQSFKFNILIDYNLNQL